jgi:hypothetical protein
MDKNRIEGLLLLLFIFTVFTIIIYVNDQKFENAEEITNWMIALFVVVVIGIFIKEIYRVIKNPKSPWRYHVKTKFFWAVIITLLCFFIVQEFKENIAENIIIYDGSNEPSGIFDYVLPAFISAVIIVTITYLNKFSNYRRDFLNIIRHLEKTSYQYDKIRDSIDDSIDKELIQMQHQISNHTQFSWNEMRSISKMALGIAILFIVFGIWLVTDMKLNLEQSNVGYFSSLTVIIFTGTMFLIHWTYLHNMVYWHEDVILTVDRMAAKFEVDVENTYHKTKN